MHIMIKPISALLAAGMLAGCSSLSQPLGSGHGNFAKVNFTEQVIDPTPADGAPQSDPNVIQGAIERHRSGDIRSNEEEGNTFVLPDVFGSAQ